MTYRLPPQPGEWIDRSRTIEFQFEGRPYSGFAGDTITSALSAHGVRLLGRSFKYHRARGVYSLANHDVNVLVDDGHRTNVRADVEPLVPGASFTAVNTFGGLEGDKARFVDSFSRFLPVGFYYKAFHSPRSLFPYYEQKMREMAGLGAIDPKLPHGHSAKRYDFCDVLVIGGGPAGLSAAVAAAECGAKVVLVDEHARAGGSLNYQRGAAGSAETADGLKTKIAGLGSLDVRTSTVCAGAYADLWYALVDADRMVKMRAKSVVFATGAMEQPAVFGNNDLPGVMLATAAQRLIHQYAVKPFERAVVVAANAEGYRAALDLKAAGVTVAAVVDLRPAGEPSEAGKAVRDAGIAIHTGHAVTQALPKSGKIGIRGVEVCPLDGKGEAETGKAFTIDCDGLAMSVGWAPADSLFYQAGGRMTWSDALSQYIPKSYPPGVFTAGRLNGFYDLAARVADGRRAGLAAASSVGLYSGEVPSAPALPTSAPSHAYPVFPHAKSKCFVDLDEDVHYKDFVNAAQEGYDQVELMKRYSTFGMGPSQGKLANANAIRILAKIKKQTVPETGVTTSRPFLHPVPLKHLAGRGFHPHRYTPLQSRHDKAGAVFLPAGEWRRPAYYAIPGLSTEVAIAEEVLAVRQRAGMIDVGTLGKIEVSGPDAGAFIERIYTGRFAGMKPGTTRYALMCDESGVIIDDGLVGRFSNDRFYVTTTTTASGAVYREMQRSAIVWGMNVVLANATGHYGGINLAGPAAQMILATLCDFDVSNAAFPYLSLREGKIAGVPARFLRVGFVGEWGCEIHVPAHGAPRVWDAVAETGRTIGIRPFGVEAQRVLRLEKAHVIVSQDTDGLTNPYEANMAWAIKNEKPFFIGQRSLQILKQKPLKRLLVGFTLPEEYFSPGTTIPKECHLIVEGTEILGRVTSITRSPTLKQVLGMAYVPVSKSKPGTTVQIRIDDGTLIPATIVDIPFYDPKAQRQIEGT